MRQALLSAAGGAAADVSAAAAAVHRSSAGLDRLHAATTTPASAACGARTNTVGSSAAAAAEAQWWAVAGLFAILIGGSLGQPFVSHDDVNQSCLLPCLHDHWACLPNSCSQSKLPMHHACSEWQALQAPESGGLLSSTILTHLSKSCDAMQAWRCRWQAGGSRRAAASGPRPLRSAVPSLQGWCWPLDWCTCCPRRCTRCR